ncbi:MJ0042-type zinc finger domain-containing protein [Marinospirillum insulare]|uniref:Zinc finger/thioredoxin putative domain-containing protein n=1 Tax=Marinospirillum insulare TaxID=217169 RepID=A0ABQ5ZX54_9GAMM|nr:MJ0042-type zinc finger domain-containing protein [Marinospirillum insulare]GLR64761.1 hypothetical protein GCM10007878_21990 [Marinospirillum insulare]
MKTTNQPKLTQCPHCQSVFDLSEEEIQLALGAVRCGECMKIFNANYHLVEPLNNKTNPEQNSRSTSHSVTANPTIQDNSIPTLQEHPSSSDLQTQTDIQPEIDLHPEDELYPEIELETELVTSTTTESTESFQITTAFEDENEDEIENEEAEVPASGKPHKKPIIAGLFFVLIAVLVGGWWVANSTPPSHYNFTEVRLSPASDPKKMEIHFKLTNTSQQKMALPSLNIQLLNLSSQPISSEIIANSELKSTLNVLEAGSSELVTVSVNRPSTFVQSARIQEYLEDTKL